MDLFTSLPTFRTTPPIWSEISFWRYSSDHVSKSKRSVFSCPVRLAQADTSTDSVEYSTESVDVSAWARRTGQENTDLLDFETWSEEYLQKLISDQIGGVVRNVGSDVKRSMAETYADVYIDYYAGRKIDAKGIRTSEGYTWWERNLPDSYLIKELNAMINDADRDNNYLLLPEDTILEERYTWKKATASEATPSKALRQ